MTQTNKKIELKKATGFEAAPLVQDCADCAAGTAGAGAVSAGAGGAAGAGAGAAGAGSSAGGAAGAGASAPASSQAAEKEAALADIRSKSGFICDMDGVVYHGNKALPGAAELVAWFKKEKKHYLFLTNASDKTPLELHMKLHRMGIDVEPEHFYTSALATAHFLASQRPGCSAYIIGDHGLHNAMYDAGIAFNDVDPDYVVVGETDDFRFEHIKIAMNLVNKGAGLIATNSDITGPIEGGFKPACKALVASIEVATGVNAYFVGKPNPLMMRTGLEILGVHSADSVMIGDRMDTDMIGGIEAGMETALVLSGVSTLKTVDEYPFNPRVVLSGVGEIPC